MTKCRRVGIAFALLLTLVLVIANIIPFTNLSNADVASAVTVQSRDEWSNSYSGTYYNNLNEDLVGTAFRSQLASLITSTHTHETTYSELASVFQKSDADPNKSGNIIWFYTGTSASFSGSFGSSVGSTNREHVWAKNGGDTFPEKSKTGSDAHHLRPTEMQLNGYRSNYGFGEVAQTTANAVKEAGSLSYGNTEDELCYLSGGLFYPAKGYRGATARILFYVQTRWGNDYNLNFIDGKTTNNGKSIGKISDLLKWHLEEPPTDEEIRRNEVVFGIQGNRNPFIDHPEYAEMIYCNDGQSYNNTLKDIVAQYGSYLDNSNVDPNPNPTLTGLTLSQTSLNLTVGETSQQISVTANPSTASNSVTWSSSNVSVATVNNGVISAVGAGTATITATSTVNTSIKATLTVTVSAKKVEVESISISPNNLTLTQGGTSQLTATVSPSGASSSVTWSSSNTSVATVTQGGFVTAVGAGTAIITATSTENTNIKATMTVTVTAKKVELQSINITPSSITLKPGETNSLTVTASPSGASNSVGWSSSNTSVATVNNGVVTAVGLGTATITATSTENTNIKATMTVTVVSDEIQLESLSILPEDVTLYLGGRENELLYATAYPSGASNLVTWSSSDERVAVVSGAGLVVAVGEGTAIITATSVDNPTISASITVTVKREQSSPEAIDEFEARMAEYNSATTLEERYNALKKAMQAFNNLSVGDREQSSEYYQTLKTAVVKYSNDATAVNDAFEREISFVAQISAASFSIAFLALAVVIVKKLI